MKERGERRRHEAVGRLVFGAGRLAGSLAGLRAEGRREGAGEAAQDRRRPRRRADPGRRGRRARLGLPGAFRTAGKLKILKGAIHR